MEGNKTGFSENELKKLHVVFLSMNVYKNCKEIIDQDGFGHS